MSKRYMYKNRICLIILLLCCSISIISCAKRKSKADEIFSYYQQAKEAFFEQSDFEKADTLLKNVLKLNPKFKADYFNFMLGYIYESKHLYNEAIAHYSKELETNKRKEVKDKEIYQFSLLYLARTYFEAGLLYKKFFNLAVNSQINYYNTKLLLRKEVITTQSLKLKPENINHLLYFRGLCYYLRGDLNEAVSDLRKVDIKSTLYLKALIKLGACYYKLGKIKEAEQTWKEVYSYSKDPIILNELGYTYAELGIKERFNQTQEWANQVPLEKGRKSLCLIHFKNNKIDKALELLKEIQLEIPDLVEERGAYISRDSNRKVKYITNFYNPAMLNHKADIYFTMAIKYYKNYLELAKNKDLIYHQIGLSQFHSNQLKDAILTFSQLINDATDTKIKAMSQINLGTCYYLDDRKEKAFSIWDNLYRNSVRDHEMLSQIGVTYARLKIRLEDALSLCEIPEARIPGELSWNLGIVYFQKGLNESKIEYFSESIGYLEKNHTQKGGYTLEIDDPSLLLDLASAYYNRRLFRTATSIIFSFRQYYPEVDQIFNPFQVVSELKGMEGINWKINWKEIGL
ncbi:MAG: tetratricopeptide repeat protein [bacterium]